VVCRPLHTRFARRVGAHGAALAVLILLFLALVVPAAWLATLAVEQAPEAVHALKEGAARLRGLPSLARVNVDTLAAHVGTSSLKWASATLGPTVGSAGHAIVNLSVALLGLYFLLVAGDGAWKALRQRLPFSAQSSDELRGVFTNVTRATLRGTLLS